MGFFSIPGKHVRSDQGRGTFLLSLEFIFQACAHRCYIDAVKDVCQEVTIETAITSSLPPCSLNTHCHFSLNVVNNIWLDGCAAAAACALEISGNNVIHLCPHQHATERLPLNLYYSFK